MLTNSTSDKRVNVQMAKVGIKDFFEVIIVSGAYKIQKPSAELVEIARKGLGVQNVIMVGDTLPKDIMSANMAGVPSIYVNIVPKRVDQNIRYINEGRAYYNA
jgi:FMN phosphatase YigB (HAD superfamily)